MLRNLSDFENKEEFVKQKIYNTFYGFCRYFENNFLLLLESINYFDKKDWPYFRWEKRYCLTLYIKLVSTFKSSYHLILTGYYPESIILTRAIYEAIVRMIFIQKNPNRGEEIIGKRFRMGEKEKELDIDESSEYSLLSSFSHGHEVPVFFDLIDVQQGKKGGISIGPQPPNENSADFLVAINMLMFYLWAVLVLIPKSLPELKAVLLWKRKYDKLMIDLENNYVRAYVNRKGEPSSIALKGVDEVLKIIKEIPDWES